MRLKKMIKVYEFLNSDNPQLKYTIPQKLVINNSNFYISKQIGGGGESFVFKIIEDIEDGQTFALKVCKNKNKINEEGIVLLANKKFNKEILIAKQFAETEYKNNFITFSCDGFALLHNTQGTKTTNHSCYVMDIADQTLEEYLCESVECDDEREILPKIKELAKTLKLLHEKNYVHRDIKPQNILVHGKLFKLADFGMVEQENTSCTKTGPKYWPTPELLNMCDEDVHCSGKQTDVFMVGCILYFIFTKKYPVGNINIDLISDEFKIKPIIKKMISYNIEDRYKNGGEVYEEIKAIRFA